MGEDLACTRIARVWQGGLFQHKEVTSDGSQSLLVKVFIHSHTHTHTHAAFSYANSVLFKQLVSHSTLLQTWPAKEPYIPFPWVLVWLVSRRTPDCAGCTAACLVWERAWALRFSNLGLPPLFVNSCRSNRTTLSPAKCFLAVGSWTDWWESEVEAQIVFQANK